MSISWRASDSNMGQRLVEGMKKKNDSVGKVICELCNEELRPKTYVTPDGPPELLYMHNDLTGARCRRIQKENNKKAKSK